MNLFLKIIYHSMSIFYSHRRHSSMMILPFEGLYHQCIAVYCTAYLLFSLHRILQAPTAKFKLLTKFGADLTFCSHSGGPTLLKLWFSVGRRAAEVTTDNLTLTTYHYHYIPDLPDTLMNRCAGFSCQKQVYSSIHYRMCVFSFVQLFTNQRLCLTPSPYLWLSCEHVQLPRKDDVKWK